MEPVFSIGLNLIKRKKGKSKKLSMNKINIFPYIQPFIIYTGPRWQIPSGIILRESIKNKFSEIEIFQTIKDIKLAISKKMRPFIFPEMSSHWKEPEIITKSIKYFYKKQEFEWSMVKQLYSKLFKFRKNLRALIFNWQIRKCLKNRKNVEDPITLDIPLKPIVIIDFKKRLSFSYDARALRRSIENRILLSDYMFPEPKEPVNPLTNTRFSFAQFISIYQQCKKYGEFSWILDDLYKCECLLSKFIIFNNQRLKIEAIHEYFKKPTYLIRETVIDFFIEEAEENQLPNTQIYLFSKAYDTSPEMVIVRQWVNITRDYYIYKELNNQDLLLKNAREVDKLINIIYHAFYSV